MSHYRFYRSAVMDVYGRGEYLGPEWTLGIWEYTEGKPCWGLMHFTQPTQMCYGLDYAKPQEAVKKCLERNFPEENPLWYFDVGNKVTVKIEDLEQAFKNLDIWDSNGLNEEDLKRYRSESTKKLIENLPEDYTPLPKGTWLQDSVEIDSEEFDRRQEIVGGMIKWLIHEQNQALYSDQSPCETIEALLKLVELCGENGEFPWEVIE